jgi:hypothetical protein
LGRRIVRATFFVQVAAAGLPRVTSRAEDSLPVAAA